MNHRGAENLLVPLHPRTNKFYRFAMYDPLDKSKQFTNKTCTNYAYSDGIQDPFVLTFKLDKVYRIDAVLIVGSCDGDNYADGELDCDANLVGGFDLYVGCNSDYT